MDHHRHRYSGAHSMQLDSRVIRVGNEILCLSDQLTEEVLSSDFLVIGGWPTLSALALILQLEYWAPRPCVFCKDGSKPRVEPPPLSRLTQR